jgi:hypothetical protein
MNEGWAEPEESAGWHDPEAYQVIALDPGGTTGWAIFLVHPDAMGGDPDIPVMVNIEWWTAGEFTGSSHSQVDEIVELVEAWPSARLVTEGFKLRQLNAELDPVEINHTVAWATRPRYWVVQPAALAMGALPDERQKALGLWVPGKPHARDAVKHAVTFLKRRKADAIKAAVRLDRAARTAR